MVIVKVMGGLGNQMFQCALARKLQMLGKRIKLDTSYYQGIPVGDTLRTKWLSEFGYSFEETLAPSKWSLDALIAKVGREKYIWKESNYNYDSSVFNVKRGYLIGYWQTEKYFDDIAPVIRRDFEFDINKLTSNEKKIYQKIKETKNTVSLHIRRGDYLDPINFDYFGSVCTELYYKKAIQYIRDRVENCKFFIFTDAPEDILMDNDSDNNCQIISNGKYNERFEMFLMSECKHHIIANSSFSWWGAWLDGRRDKIVIAPEQWTNKGDRQDIFCKDWIRISGNSKMAL